MYNFDLRGVFFFAVIGLIAAAVTIIVGVPYAVWWLIHHIQFV